MSAELDTFEIMTYRSFVGIAIVLAVAVYVNFFAHHWLPDIRLVLFALMALLFARTRVHFTVWRAERWMPLLLGWLLVALFIWFAENIGTFARAWSYPDQADGWRMVSPAKLGAWYLLMYISFTLVAVLHRAGDERERLRSHRPVQGRPSAGD